jgi:hypothetical protein
MACSSERCQLESDPPAHDGSVPGEFADARVHDAGGGSARLTRFTYYAGRYEYAPIDKAGNRTDMVVSEDGEGSREGPDADPQSPAQHGCLPHLPAANDWVATAAGKLVKSIKSPTEVMVGEFSSAGNEKFVMVVNLSLERSAKVILKAQAKRIERVSPVDRSLAPLAKDGSLWLPAGQGMLLRTGRSCCSTGRMTPKN